MMRKRSRKERAGDPFPCPHCGAFVPARASSCPKCGSDDNTGWAEDSDKWAADIPTGYAEDDEFDYDQFVEREFGGNKDSILGIQAWAVVLALFGVLVIAILVLWVFAQ